ncbi:DUF3124 domain-containing protein [Fundidesulfovibrio agrisoli]|uniref:DUF3124 domain-containing protein n=1 Tax=Fundidesulfovibrio agrisoli TaxID=2922717 RepID=UPI001FAE631B|nr:DUF3124 domain-containing protein [Fundidesulfovibrio agrisoli]
MLPTALRTLLCALLLMLLTHAPARAQTPAVQSPAVQAIYVPCYSHIYHGMKNLPLDLTVTLSIRNTDPERPIRLVSVDYYDTNGGLVRSYLTSKTALGPMMTWEAIVAERDRSGGSGANFLVRWEADGPVSQPLAEAVMIGTSSQQGISFSSRGVPVR